MQSKIEHEKKACLDIDRFWTNVQWVTKWVLVGPNGSQWVPVGPNGSQWIPMGPNGLGGSHTEKWRWTRYNGPKPSLGDMI